jgi:hypothetical protein
MFTIDFYYGTLRQHFDKLSASAQGPYKVGEPVDEPVELAEPPINLITGYKDKL